MKNVFLKSPDYKYLYQFRIDDFNCSVVRLPIIGKNDNYMWVLPEDENSRVFTVDNPDEYGTANCIVDNGEVVIDDVVDEDTQNRCKTVNIVSNNDSPNYIQPDFLCAIEEKLEEARAKYEVKEARWTEAPVTEEGKRAREEYLRKRLENEQNKLAALRQELVTM